MEISDEDIIKACELSNSMRGASIMLNMPLSTFIRRCIKIGCYKPNQGWNKGLLGFEDKSVFRKYNFEDYFTENSKVSRSSVKKMILKLNLIPYICNICKIDNWLGQEIVLHLDHINGVRNDNRIDNLRFLCPNCHSQTETYCNSNFTLNTKHKISDYNDDEIIFVIKRSYSITEVLNYLTLLDTIKNRNILKTYLDKYNISFSRKYDYNKVCECGDFINFRAKRCKSCAAKKQHKVSRPTYEQLLSDIEETNYSATGKKYGVSDNAIRKWIKYYEKNLK